MYFFKFWGFCRFEPTTQPNPPKMKKFSTQSIQRYPTQPNPFVDPTQCCYLDLWPKNPSAHVWTQILLWAKLREMPFIGFWYMAEAYKFSCVGFVGWMTKITLRRDGDSVWHIDLAFNTAVTGWGSSSKTDWAISQTRTSQLQINIAVSIRNSWGTCRIPLSHAQTAVTAVA